MDSDVFLSVRLWGEREEEEEGEVGRGSCHSNDGDT